MEGNHTSLPLNLEANQPLMAKSKVIDETEVQEKEPKGDRQARWEKHLENYKVQNPVRYARLEADGELDSIPESFV